MTFFGKPITQRPSRPLHGEQLETTKHIYEKSLENNKYIFEKLYEDHKISKNDVEEMLKDDLVRSGKKLGLSKVSIQKNLDFFERKFDDEQNAMAKIR